MVAKTATPKKTTRKSLAAAQEKTIKKINEEIPQSKKNQKMVKAVKSGLVATPAKGKKGRKPQKEEVVDESSDEAPEELEIGEESDEEPEELEIGKDSDEEEVEGSEASGDDVEMEDEADPDSEQPEDEEELKEAKPKVEKTPKASNPTQSDDCEIGFGHTIFVGNLPPNVTRAEIAKLFEPYGKIMSIIFRTKQLATFFRNRNKSAHNAYVVLDSQEGAAKSYELQNTLIEGKKIFLQNPEKVENSSFKNTVICKKLSPNTTEESLRKLFSPCGEIDYISLVNFNSSAYVCFRNSDAIKPALELKGTELDGQKIAVNPYGKRPEEAAEGTVFVKNLKSTTTQETITEIFSRCGEVEKVVIKQAIKGGYAFVSFKEAESKTEAYKLNGTQIEGNEIEVFPYQGTPSFKKNLGGKRFNNKQGGGDFKTQMQRVGSKYLGKKPHPGKFNNAGKFNSPGKFNNAGKFNSPGKFNKPGKFQKPAMFQKPGTFRGVKPTGGIKKGPKKFTPKKV